MTPSIVELRSEIVGFTKGRAVRWRKLSSPPPSTRASASPKTETSPARQRPSTAPRTARYPGPTLTPATCSSSQPMS